MKKLFVLVLAVIHTFVYSQESQNWNIVSTYLDEPSSKDKMQWFLLASGDTLYSLGAFGIKAFDTSDKTNPNLVAQSKIPSETNKWARSLSTSDEILYVATRQASAGKAEDRVPDFRFRFEGKTSDFNNSLDEFDQYINLGNITMDELGEPDLNYGRHSLRVISSSNLSSNSCALLVKNDNDGSIENQKFSSLWIKINKMGQEQITIPLRRNDDEDILSLIVTPISDSDFQISLTNPTHFVQAPVFKTNEWFCVKVLMDNSVSKLWWRTKECAEWNLSQEGEGGH